MEEKRRADAAATKKKADEEATAKVQAEGVGGSAGAGEEAVWVESARKWIGNAAATAHTCD